MANETGQVGQNRKTREVCVGVNRDSYNREERYIGQDFHNEPMRGIFMPHAFKIQKIPKVGYVVLLKGSSSTGYYLGCRDNDKCFPHRLNVAGLLACTETEATTDRHGDKYVKVFLIDEKKDSELIAKIKEQLRKEGITANPAFQT